MENRGRKFVSNFCVTVPHGCGLHSMRHDQLQPTSLPILNLFSEMPIV